MEEAKAGQSSKDFIHKNSISLKEDRESKYWLRLLSASYDFEAVVTEGIKELEQEASELANIVGKIIVNSKNGS